jgi:hypothetical protein
MYLKEIGCEDMDWIIWYSSHPSMSEEQLMGLSICPYDSTRELLDGFG